MRNFERIVKDVANLRWSTVELDDSFAEVESSIKLAIQQANAFLFGLKDFPFRIKKGGYLLKSGENAFNGPQGTVTDLWIEDSGSYLKKIDDGDLLNKSDKGEPKFYWVDFGQDGIVIHLYPTPEKTYNILYKFSTYQKARDMSGEEKANLEDSTDVVNIPDNAGIEDMYMQCLYTKAMTYLIADTNDENYLPYIKEYEEAYRNLLSVTGIKKNPRIII